MRIEQTNETLPLRPEAVIVTPPEQGHGSFLRHYGSTVVSQGLILGVGVFTGVLAARMLGPTGRGELAAIIIWPMAIVMLLSLGMNQAITFLVGRKAFGLNEIATGSLVIGLAQSVLCVGLALLIVPHTLAKYPANVRHLGLIFALISFSIVASGYSGNLFQGKQQFLLFNVIRAIPGLIYLFGLFVLMASHRASLEGVVYSQGLGYVAALLFGIFLVWWKFKPSYRWQQEVVSRMLSYGWRTQLTTLTYTFNQRIDQLFLSLFVPAQQLGLYAVAVTLSNAVTAFPQAAGIVTFSRGSGQHNADLRITLRTSLRASFGWLLICCSALYLLCPVLITLVFGARFAGSATACRILLPGTMLVGLSQVLYSAAAAAGRPGLPSIAEGVSVGITAVGLYLLVPRYGFIGAAIVSSVAYSISFIVMLFMMSNILDVKITSLFLNDSVVESTPSANVVEPGSVS